MSHLPWRVGIKKVMEKAVKPKDRIKDWKIVRGDQVEITAGPDKGERGTVLEVHRRWNTMLVSGCRLNKKRAHGPNGEKTYLYELESPIHYGHVHLIDPSDDKPCAVTYKYTDEGERVRVSERTNTEIPKPRTGRRDMENKWTDYEEGPKDTKNAELLLKTYFPEKVKTFAQEIRRTLKPAEQFNYPPKNLPHMRRDRRRYAKVTDRPTLEQWLKQTEWHNTENLQKAYEETIAGIEALKAKDLDDFEKKLVRDAALEKVVNAGETPDWQKEADKSRK